MPPHDTLIPLAVNPYLRAIQLYMHNYAANEDDVARKLGVDRSSINRWFSGRHKMRRANQQAVVKCFPEQLRQARQEALEINDGAEPYRLEFSRAPLVTQFEAADQDWNPTKMRALGENAVRYVPIMAGGDLSGALGVRLSGLRDPESDYGEGWIVVVDPAAGVRAREQTLVLCVFNDADTGRQRVIVKTHIETNEQCVILSDEEANILTLKPKLVRYLWRVLQVTRPIQSGGSGGSKA